MRLTLTRLERHETYTLGRLDVNGSFFCHTLEPTERPLGVKVYGKTAIPKGSYAVIVNRSPRFGRDLPRLLNVPYFDGILIHRGNYPRDTQGCILVGEWHNSASVLNSTPYEERLTKMLKEAQDRKEESVITIL